MYYFNKYTKNICKDIYFVQMNQIINNIYNFKYLKLDESMKQ